MALPGENYKLAFTPGLLVAVYQRKIGDQPPEILLPNAAAVLGSQGPDGGGYVDLHGDGHWWIPSGRVFYHTDPEANSQQELDQARHHFCRPRRFEDPFGHNSTVDYDAHDLLSARTVDAVENTVSAVNDYRVLQPTLSTDPNGNRSAVAFDALGMVVGTALMGKENESTGDSLTGFIADLTPQQIDDFFNATDPHDPAHSLLTNATTRIIYNPDSFRNTGQPVFAATFARETHASDPLPPYGLKIQITFSYSDGFGREIQKKFQAESGPIVEGGPVISTRWVASGWTIFNNKGKPVRQYEPFFSQLAEKRHRFEFGVQVGVSPVVFYDPTERAVATLLPNQTYEKVVFDPWKQTTYDVNDTVTFEPQIDLDTGGLFSGIPNSDYLPTWYHQRITGAKGVDEKIAAEKAAKHASTPTVAHLDTLGRIFFTIADNAGDGRYETHVDLDIGGNRRSITDALGRKVMVYSYDTLETQIYQASMDTGERWMLNDVVGKPIRIWDRRGHSFRRSTIPCVGPVPICSRHRRPQLGPRHAQ